MADAPFRAAEGLRVSPLVHPMVDDDPMTLNLPISAEANDLLSSSPLALLTAMLLDQQVPLEKAFSSPFELTRRLGHEPTAAELAEFDPDALAEIFAQRPALHRFPKAMARRVAELAAVIVGEYDGDAERVWTQAADGHDLVARLAKLPGFGSYKAQITTALLGKQLGVRPAGWREAAGRFGEAGSHYSVADIVDDASLAAVRAHKKEAKAAAKAAASR
jgi:uncharacterized HhH-GPD family protein